MKMGRVSATLPGNTPGPGEAVICGLVLSARVRVWPGRRHAPEPVAPAPAVTPVDRRVERQRQEEERERRRRQQQRRDSYNDQEPPSDEGAGEDDDGRLHIDVTV